VAFLLEPNHASNTTADRDRPRRNRNDKRNWVASDESSHDLRSWTPQWAESPWVRVHETVGA